MEREEGVACSVIQGEFSHPLQGQWVRVRQERAPSSCLGGAQVLGGPRVLELLGRLQPARGLGNSRIVDGLIARAREGQVAQAYAAEMADSAIPREEVREGWWYGHRAATSPLIAAEESWAS